jgi:N utilization substance protein B
MVHMKKRRRARELALQGMYSLEISGNSLELVLEQIFQGRTEDEDISSFTTDLLRKTVEHKASLDQDVASVVENWEFGRIALVDRLILRLALCELFYFEEIPPKVTINEAIDLAKEYSTAQSGRFVNGILDSLYRRFKSENKIKKRGRGLME